MPHFTNPIGPLGAFLPVFITVSGQRATALVAAQQAVPQPIPANLLIDTGSNSTIINQPIIAALGGLPTGGVIMNTSSSGANGVLMLQYDVGLVAIQTGMTHYTANTLPVLASDFSGAGIDGVLGRDSLANVRFIYSGPDNACYLST